jgi:hypothetical protein
MHESNSTKLFLQPIPAQDFVQISGISSDTHVKIQLKSATGQLVRVVENSSVINLANVPSGMYLIDIEFHGTVHHFKILKH